MFDAFVATLILSGGSYLLSLLSESWTQTSVYPWFLAVYIIYQGIYLRVHYYVSGWELFKGLVLAAIGIGLLTFLLNLFFGLEVLVAIQVAVPILILITKLKRW
jgi:hypothetical protein